MTSNHAVGDHQLQLTKIDSRESQSVMMSGTIGLWSVGHNAKQKTLENVGHRNVCAKVVNSAVDTTLERENCGGLF